jgi:hypothetical protein
MTMPATAVRPRAWSYLGLLGLVGFIFLTLAARYAPLDAQEAKAKKKAARAALNPARAALKKSPITGPAAPLTKGRKVDAADLARLIDAQVEKRQAEEKVKPAPVADDAEFIRRVYLDLVGVIPPPEKVKEFLDSKDANKRSKLIDSLLADSRFGNHLAETWCNLMVPRESNNRALKSMPLQTWLADGFNAGKPLNKLVFDLVTATGSQADNGAVTYFIGNPTADKITDNVTRMFLGVQLQCAQCHNHPFTDYKQTEYWAVAAFFMKTRISANPQQAAKKGVAISVVESNKALKKKKGLPESAKIVPAKFLRGAEPKIAANEPARPYLAKWMTSDTNPFFARAMANRFWYQLFGRGIVNPVDDMHDDNAPVYPELLATLTEQLKLHGYDTKYLVRAICNSKAYQRTSQAVEGKSGSDDIDLYARRALRVMSPEQLYDSYTAVVGKDARNGKAGRNKAQKKGPQGPRDQFVNFFRVEDFNPLDYQNGIPQALRLMNSAQLNNTNAAVTAAMQDSKAPADVIERLYLTALARRPTADETQRLTAHVRRQSNPRAAYGDILWAILNSSEFVLNH